MLLKCKLLISFNCSTSHVINHNNFLSFLQIFFASSPLFRQRDVLVTSVMVWLEMWLCAVSFIPNLLVCLCSGDCEWAGDCRAVIGKCMTDLLRWRKHGGEHFYLISTSWPARKYGMRLFTEGCSLVSATGQTFSYEARIPPLGMKAFTGGMWPGEIICQPSQRHHDLRLLLWGAWACESSSPSLSVCVCVCY